jgi:hypothetical protein
VHVTVASPGSSSRSEDSPDLPELGTQDFLVELVIIVAILIDQSVEAFVLAEHLTVKLTHSVNHEFAVR